MDYIDDSEESRTLFCGNLPSKCTEELLYELFLQAGPLEKVRIPLDREGRPASYGFVTFRHQCSVPYAINIFDGITMFKARLNLRLRSSGSNNAMSTPTQIISNMMAASPSQSPMALYQCNQNMTPNYGSNREHNNRTPSGRNDYYRNESLQGRWNSHPYKRDRDMRPVESRRHNSNYKRHKR